MIWKKRTSATPRPHLVLRLKPGWSYEVRPRRFVSADGRAFYPKADLPKYTRIRYQVPVLAKKCARTPDEDALVRGILVIPPKSESTGRLLKRLQAWPCVEKVWIAPTPEPAV